MDAKVGDEIVVDGAKLGRPTRKGEIVEVRPAGNEHYVVRWEDGHESVFFPGPTAHVVNRSLRR